MNKFNKKEKADLVTKTAITLRGADLDILISLGEALNANSEVVVALALSYKYGLTTSANLLSYVGTKKYIGNENIARRQTFIKHTADEKKAIDDLILEKNIVMSKLGDNYNVTNVSLVQASLFKFSNDYFDGVLDWNATPALSKFAKFKKIK